MLPCNAGYQQQMNSSDGCGGTRGEEVATMMGYPGEKKNILASVNMETT